MFYFTYGQNKKHFNWISGSFFSHSLNNKSLQVMEIHDLNKKNSIFKNYIKMTGKVETSPDII